jgi:hypothetical protein
MFSPDQLAKPRDNDLEKYIQENLCDHQLKWLTMQSRALGYSRIRIFEAILSDWLSRHSSRERWPTGRVPNRPKSDGRIHFPLSAALLTIEVEKELD